MTSAQRKENIEDGLERLKFAYHACMQGYNRARLKDLAQILRYWADLKSEADVYIAMNRPTTMFWSYSLTKMFFRQTKSCEHVIVNFPGSVVAKVLPDMNPTQPGIMPGQLTHMLEIPLENHPTGTPITYSLYQAQQAPYFFSIKYLMILFDARISLDGPTHDPKMDARCFAYTKAKFGPWLGHLAIQVNKKREDGELVRFALSRETIIRRVANAFGASHPEGGYEMDNENDPVIRYLMEFKAIDLPLPYTVLLKIAHDILQGFSYL